MSALLSDGLTPAWLSELAWAKVCYAERHGWPCAVRAGSRELAVTAGPALSAVSMPSGLGARVRTELGIAMLGGPVFADRPRQEWTFLAGPLTAMLRSGIADRLAAWRVCLAGSGTEVVIPTGEESAAGAVRWWIDEPVPLAALPPAYAVIAVVRRLTNDEYPIALAA